MKKIISITILFILFALSNSIAQEQNLGKHPKVIEVEMLITKDATAFLKQRIPNGQVYVNVDIEPLRRNPGEKSEQLPYLYTEDDVGDEWDVLDTPMVLLLSRIKKATIKVEVPSSVTDLELIDLKEKLYEQLKLIPGRDSISIDRKIAVVKTEEKAPDYSLYYFVTLMSFLVFAGLYISLRFGPKTAIAEKSNAKDSGNQAPASSIQKSSSGSSKQILSGTSGSINSKVNGDINFKDSLRAADMLKEKLHGVVNAPIFPLLSDLLVLDELSNKSLSSFGAFVFEMPRKQQQKVFFRGRSDKWFRGYVEAATVDLDCFMAVEKMLRNRTASGSDKWEELLIQVWRLDADAHLFLKQIPSNDVFTILSFLPKSFSVPAAKRSFPGGWAKILEIKDEKPFEDEAKIDNYIERTLSLKPHFSFKSIDDYRKDIELIDYIKTTSIKDEEEIYESLNSQSPIHNIRPPFYVIFKADSDDFKMILSLFDLQEWALATINSHRDYIKRIINELDDKKKYLFSNYLKQLDDEQVQPSLQFELREKIAKRFREIQITKNNSNDKKNDSQDEHNENINTQAA